METWKATETKKDCELSGAHEVMMAIIRVVMMDMVFGCVHDLSE